MGYTVLKEQLKVNPNKGYKQFQSVKLTLESASTHEF